MSFMEGGGGGEDGGFRDDPKKFIFIFIFIFFVIIIHIQQILERIGCPGSWVAKAVFRGPGGDEVVMVVGVQVEGEEVFLYWVDASHPTPPNKRRENKQQ